jgi:hypothetical protein
LISTIGLFTHRADLIRNTALIVWEELAASNVAAFHCCEELCQRVMGNNKPMGGIPFVGLGDFRQVAPVVQGQGVTPALQASIKTSHLWKQFEVFSLKHPFRSAQDPAYTNFVDNIGEDYSNRTVDLHILQRLHNIDEVIAFLFPPYVLRDPLQCLKRAFLSPRNIYVDEFNTALLDILPGQSGMSFTDYKCK